MSTVADSPMNTAHQHSANAEEYLAKGLLVSASEEHLKAAESYLAAIGQSNDDSTKRTLRMLYQDHIKAAKELQRRISKLEEEGKNPNLPQKPDAPRTSTFRHSGSGPMQGAPSRVNNTSPRPMSDSQGNPAEESFMLLGGQRSDPGDAFNQFWNIMQGMLENLSQPVAFATAPLGDPEVQTPQSPGAKTEEKRRDRSLSSDTDSDEPIFSKFTRRIGLTRDVGKSTRSQSSQQSTQDEDDAFDSDFMADGDDLSGSFYVVSSGPEPSPAALKRENTALKSEVAAMKTRLEAMDKVIKIRKEQDLQLRDSIYMATREAQRALGASTVLGRAPAAPAAPLDFSSLNINAPNVPIPGINSPREAHLVRRIKELEDETKQLRVENDKLKLDISKFRQRWEKLKESAKRKKEAKVAAASVRERIVEEPEAEEELDETKPPVPG